MKMRKRAFAMPASSARRNALSITKSPATAPPEPSRLASSHDDFADLLEEKLNEEKETDAKLTELAESAVNSDAAATDVE